MIFLKVPVGMRKTATLTMEKTVRGGTTYKNITIFQIKILPYKINITHWRILFQAIQLYKLFKIFKNRLILIFTVFHG